MQNQISRRNLLKGLGIGAAGIASGMSFGSLGRPALAQGGDLPAASAFYKYALGQMELTFIQDGSAVFPSDNFAVNQPAGEADKVLAEYNLPQKNTPISVNVLLVKSGNELLLLDSGANEQTLGPGAPRLGGRLIATLALVGIKPEAITGVILSHFHGDHIAGIANGNAPAFPNATVYIPEPEQAFLDNAPAGTPLDAQIQNAKAKLAVVQDRVKTYKADAEVLPGLLAVATPGHSVGHTSLLLNSDGQELMYAGDAVVNALISLKRPDFYFGFDQDGAQAVTSRKSLLDTVSSKTTPLFAAHFSFPGLGYVEKSGDGYNYTPAV